MALRQALVLAASAASFAAACSDSLGIQDPSGHLPDASAVDGSYEGGEADGSQEASLGDGRADADDARTDASFDAPNDAVDASVDALDEIARTSDGGCPSLSSEWTPGSLPRLVVWLDAARLSVGPGSIVDQWPDQSPAHNDAAQPTVGYQPILELGAIGGLPAVRFDGQSSYLSIADSSSMQWGTGDYTVIVVARFSILGPANQNLFQKTTYDSPYSGPVLFVNSKLPVQGTQATVANSANVYASSKSGLNDAPHLFGARRFGTTLEVRVDGAPAAQTTSSVDVSAPTMPAIIGQNGYAPSPGNEALMGDIAEVVAVGGTISDSDLRSLECHLMVKYGM